MTSTGRNLGVWAADMFDRSWRTGLQVFAAYLVIVLQAGGMPLNLLAGVLQALFAVVLSVITAMLAMPSFGEAWYFQLAERAVKTFFQTMLAGIGTATMFAEVDWHGVWEMSWTAAVLSIATSVATTRLGATSTTGQVNLTAPPRRIAASGDSERSGASGF